MLLPETQARRKLAGRAVSLTVLAPLGGYLGCGALRVLRVRTGAASVPGGEPLVHLDCGYESYVRRDCELSAAGR